MRPGLAAAAVLVFLAGAAGAGGVWGLIQRLHVADNPCSPPEAFVCVSTMPPERHIGSNDHLDQLGQGVGFFKRFADSYWKSTRMELDLVHQEGDTWRKIAGRIKGGQCREFATHQQRSIECQLCFQETYNRAVLNCGFQTGDCHAGRRFSICSLGECNGRNLLLLAGRVLISDSDPPDGVADASPASLRAGAPPVKSIVQYDAAIALIELSLPYLRSRLNIESILCDRNLSPMVRKACRFVDKHYSGKLSLGTIAAACRVSEDHLCHVFSKQTGHPLTRYICAVRIGHAMYLLNETKMSITEICFEVGYQSVSQFNRAFRAMKKMSPSEFRKARHS
jgi:AraC-like DNA-binding protein